MSVPLKSPNITNSGGNSVGSAFGACILLLPEHPLDSCEDLLDINRLGEVTIHSGGKTALEVSCDRMRCQGNNWR